MQFNGGYGKPFYLTADSGEAVSVTTTSATQRKTFNMRGLPIRTAGKWGHCARIVVRAKAVVTQSGGTGSAINDDRLGKIISSISISSPARGTIAAAKSATGAVLRQVVNPVLNGYKYPQPPEPQVAAANGSYTRYVDIAYDLAIPGFANPLDGAHPLALLEGGKVEVEVAASSVLASISTGCTLDSVELRVALEIIPDDELWIPAIYELKLHQQAGSTDAFRLQQLGDHEGIKHVESGPFALSMVAMLTDATGIGLGGSDGADNVTKISCEALGIVDLEDPAWLFRRLFSLMGRIPMGWTTTPVYGFPYGFHETAYAPGNVDGALVLPLRMPAIGQKVARLQRWYQTTDIPIKYTFTSQPSGEMKHITLEHCRIDVASFDAQMRGLYGKALDGLVPVPDLGSREKVITPDALKVAPFGVRYVYRKPSAVVRK